VSRFGRQPEVSNFEQPSHSREQYDARYFKEAVFLRRVGSLFLGQAWVSVGPVWVRLTLTPALFSGGTFLKRIAGLWPYFLIAIALTGFVYQFWSSSF
jgi:hypothetical protein